MSTLIIGRGIYFFITFNFQISSRCEYEERLKSQSIGIGKSIQKTSFHKGMNPFSQNLDGTEVKLNHKNQRNK